MPIDVRQRFPHSVTRRRFAFPSLQPAVQGQRSDGSLEPWSGRACDKVVPVTYDSKQLEALMPVERFKPGGDIHGSLEAAAGATGAATAGEIARVVRFVVDGVMPSDSAHIAWIVEDEPGAADELLSVLAAKIRPVFQPLDILASEFLGDGAADDLWGSPPGYEGCLEGGDLTEHVRRFPHSLITVRGLGEDPSDKAVDSLTRVMYSIAKYGSIMRGGERITFANSIVLTTTHVPIVAAAAPAQRLQQFWRGRYQVGSSAADLPKYVMRFLHASASP